MVKVSLKSDKVYRYLAEKGLSQNSLAMNLGISSGYISQLLSGKRFPSPHMRNRLLKRFKGYRYEDLFEIINE